MRLTTPLVAAALVLAACSSSSSTKGITVGTAATGDVSAVVEAAGTVTARATAAVTAPASGTVAALLVPDGSTVTAGQPILSLDSPSAQAALAQAKAADATVAASAAPTVQGPNVNAALAQADAAAQQAFTVAQQGIDALPTGPQRDQLQGGLATAEQQYAAARGAANSAVATVQQGVGALNSVVGSLGSTQRAQTRAAVAAAQATVDALTLKAPVAGVVELGTGASTASAAVPSALTSLLGGLGGGAASAATSGSSTSVSALSVGVPVSAGATLATVYDLSSLGLSVSVDETDVLSVTTGTRADVTLDAITGATYGAQVESVDQAPSSAAAGGVSYTARLLLGDGTQPDPAGGTQDVGAPRPRPGMSATVDLKVAAVTGAVTIPATALVTGSGGVEKVWTVDGAGKAHSAVVRVGVQGASSVQVVSGLAVGTRVVTAGTDKVTEGKKVV